MRRIIFSWVFVFVVLLAGTSRAGTYELSSATFSLDATPLDAVQYRGLNAYKVVDLSGTIFRSATYEILPVYEDALSATSASSSFVLYE